jgi:hypothetical protein
MSIMQTLMTSTLNSAGSSAVLVMSLVADSYSGSGTTWPDGSGNNYSGTLVNSPTFTNVTPKYFTFDRNSTQFVQGPSVGSLDTWTIESWFRVSEELSNTTGTAIITTTYQEDGGNFYGNINYCLSNYNSADVNVDNLLRAGFYTGNNGEWHQTAGFTPTLNTWYHVICTYDGTNLQQWVNGTFNSGQIVGQSSVSSGGPVRIARRWDYPATSGSYFPGDIATVKIYNGVLSDAEIFDAWNGSRGTYGL